jgi:hypothetical protein
MVEIPPPYAAVFSWKGPTCRAEIIDRRTAFDRSSKVIPSDWFHSSHQKQTSPDRVAIG